MTNPNKKRQTSVNEIEKIYVTEGVYSKNFTSQLINFIGYVLNRYSNGISFADDMVHFTYLRVMERLGAIQPEAPECSYPVKSEKDLQKNREALEKWNLEGRKCLFDASRSNLGNYIFSIARNAHSNYTYHNSKKFKELEPSPVEIQEQGVQYDFKDVGESSRILSIKAEDSEFLPESIRRYLLWKQNA